MKLSKFVAHSKLMTNVFALIVLVDAVCTCVDVDARADGRETPRWAQVTTDTCLALYTIELVMLIVAKGRRVLTDWMFLLDLFVIVCGYVEMMLLSHHRDLPLQTIGDLRALRLARILRLTRLLRRTRGFRELQKLVRISAGTAMFVDLVFKT